MNRKHLKFYINRHGRLGIIWYSKRVRILDTLGGNNLGPVPDDKPQWVVRRQIIGEKSAMRHNFNFVTYAWNEWESKLFVDHFVQKRWAPVPSQITDAILAQLVRAPMVWTKALLEYMRLECGVHDADLEAFKERLASYAPIIKKKDDDWKQRLEGLFNEVL